MPTWMVSVSTPRNEAEMMCAPCEASEASAGARREEPIENNSRYDVVVCGAGAAGTTFARTFAETTADIDGGEDGDEKSFAPPSRRVLLIDRGGCAKTVERVERVTRRASVYGARAEALEEFRAAGVTTTTRAVVACDAEKKTVTLDDGVVVRYGALCVATGASPRCPLPETCDGDGVDVHEVRDVESAEALARRVSESARASSSSSTRRIALAGNGGIALELVDALCGRGMALDGLESCELVWLVKHASVGDAFFDVDVADFLARALELRRRRDDGDVREEMIDWFALARSSSSTTTARAAKGGKRRKFGAAAGPDWISTFRAEAKGTNGTGRRRMRLRVVKNVEIRDAIKTPEGTNALTLTDGETIEVDAVVAAAGVEPRCEWLDEKDAPRSPIDGGVLVDECMRVVGRRNDSIFAVGDACSMEKRASAAAAPWFQMRLWSQAAQTGAFAAKVAAGACDGEALGFNFELFTHCTTFFGLKVILLGLYNAQKLESEPASDVVTYQRETLSENPEECQYVRVLLLRGRMMGAVLVGETDLEETFENLILDGVDLSRFGPHLIDPDVDLEDYFD